jgi:hypothetical protein
MAGKDCVGARNAAARSTDFRLLPQLLALGPQGRPGRSASLNLNNGLAYGNFCSRDAEAVFDTHKKNVFSAAETNRLVVFCAGSVVNCAVLVN